MLTLNAISRDFFQSLVFDWRILSGRRGCRWGGFLFYFVCRYLSFVPILSVVILWSTGVGPTPEGAMSDGSPHQGAHHLCAQVVRYVGEVRVSSSSFKGSANQVLEFPRQHFS